MNALTRAICAAVCRVHGVTPPSLFRHGKQPRTVSDARAALVHAIRTLLGNSYPEIERELSFTYKSARRGFERTESAIRSGDPRAKTAFAAASEAVKEMRRPLPTLDGERAKSVDTLGLPDDSFILAHVGDRIREARQGLNLAIEELAREQGLSVRHFRRFERGEIELSITRLRQLCIDLGLSADEVLGIGKAAAE